MVHIISKKLLEPCCYIYYLLNIVKYLEIWIPGKETAVRKVSPDTW